MATHFERQLEALHVQIITMGSFCEKAISLSNKAIRGEDCIKAIFETDREIDTKEREIENLCMRILLHQQPVARDLRQIADSLRQSGSYAGALDLNYRDFSRQYEYMNQLIIRSSCRCYLVMVTMETAADTLPHIEEIEQALSQMEQSIRQTIRRVDVCTRYSAMQYLIILFEPIETQIPNIMDRIFIQYYKHSKNHSFQPGYEYLTMTEMKENDDK